MKKHFARRNGRTPCGLRWAGLHLSTPSTQDRTRVTCRRCLAFLDRWPNAV